jgi:flagellar protein FliS
MKGIATYQDTAISTQTRGRLVVLLYDGAVKFLRLALQALEDGDWARKGEYINRATAILNELDSCLDLDAGGDVAANLRRLYQFCIRHLGEANLHRDPQRIEEVIGILVELNEGWKVVAR